MIRSQAAALAASLALAMPCADAQEIAPGDRLSGYATMAPETRAMQDDDAANPGMLWVLDGEARWARAEGARGRACADCHGDARETMRGVAARYPAYDPVAGRVIDLEDRVNACRARHQEAPPLARESAPLLGLTTYLAHQSRGLPLAPAIDGPARATLELGRALFQRRQGQFDFSCSQCHDQNWGKRLAGSTIPQAHPTGYPLYRLEWQGVGSLQRRLRACMVGMRAEPYAPGSEESVALALYLAWRARGMSVETPAVRP